MSKFDYAADAPEVFNHVAPEVAPGRGIQVFYDSSPPEALTIKPEETIANPSLLNANPPPKRRKKRTLLIVAIVVLAITLSLGLGLGLGLGLRQAEEQDTKADATVSADSGAPTTAIHFIKRHGIINNTSFTALAFRNGQRFLYFQEATGAFRRATFNPTTEVWAVSTDTRLPSGAKNNTPLAGVVYPGPDITLFYVNQNSDVDCIEFSTSDPFNGGCSIRENSVNFPSNAVAGESTQISATTLMPAGVPPGLLLVYEEPSGKIAVILGYEQEDVNNLWYWINVTDKFDSLLSASQSGKAPEGRITTGCNSGWASGEPSSDILYLSCFVTKDSDPTSSYIDYLISFQILVNGTLPGNFTVDIDNPGKTAGGSNIASVRSLAEGSNSVDTQVWFSQSGFESSFGGGNLPKPGSDFPFQRLASTLSKKTYLYHQLSDLVIAEDVWDGDTVGSWTSGNITISTTVMGKNGLEDPIVG
ncbi:MAG: hypothetical protein Q9226_006411 [Calogaya cf. arnoldii]